MMVATTTTPPTLSGVVSSTPSGSSDEYLAASTDGTSFGAALSTTDEVASTTAVFAPFANESDSVYSTVSATDDVGSLTASTVTVTASDAKPGVLPSIPTVAPPINRRRATSADGGTGPAAQRTQRGFATNESRGGSGGVRPIPPFVRSSASNNGSTSWAGRKKKLFSMILDSPRRAVRRGVGGVRRQQSEDSLVGHLPFPANARASSSGAANIGNGGRRAVSSSPSAASVHSRPRALQGFLQRRDENVNEDIQRRTVRAPAQPPTTSASGRAVVTRAASAYGLLESRQATGVGNKNIASAAAAAAASCMHDIGSEDSDEEMFDEAERVESALPLQVPSIGLKTRGLDDEAYYARMSRKNVLEWLQDDSPSDILPKVLSFAGARKLSILSRVSKSLRALVMTEPVWRTLCEDTGKWVAPPSVPEGGMKAEVAAAALTPRVSWKQYYRDCPLVPVDYNTLEAAFAAVSEPLRNAPLTRLHPDVSGPGSPLPRQRRNVRILLRPGTYVIKACLVVQAVGVASVTIETVNVNPTEESYFGEGWNCSDSASSSSTSSPYESYYDYDELIDSATPTSPARRITRRLTTTGLRGMLTCRSNSAMTVEDHDPMMNPAHVGRGAAAAGTATASMPNLPTSDGRGPHSIESPDSSSSSSSLSPSSKGKPCMGTRRGRAVIILKTKRQNEPILRVTQGALRLSRVDLVHNTLGTDIWNGNSAIQVQPPFDVEDNPIRAVPPSLPPTAVLAHVDVTSLSGRGIVNIDGGYITVRNSYIHHCAATGLYVGGPGSVATIERTDVVRNGGGNERSRRGIARGHSGVYLEQGVATLRDCNISHNTLTGISAVSQDNATLSVEGSDLVANGSIQLEMPPDGSASRRRSVSRNNTISNSGTGRSRSGLLTGGGGLLFSMHGLSSQGSLVSSVPLTRSMSTGASNTTTTVAVSAGVPVRRDEVERLIRRGGASAAFRGFPTNGGLLARDDPRRSQGNLTRSISFASAGVRPNANVTIFPPPAAQRSEDLDEESVSIAHPPEIVATAANSASAAAASRAAATRRSALRRAASWR